MNISSIKKYLVDLEKDFSTGKSTEHTYRSYLKALVESITDEIVATNEPKHVVCGAPDFVVSKKTNWGLLTVGHIEAKDIGKSLDEAERSEQGKRYLKSLENLILTDYLEFRWYVDGQRRKLVRLGSTARSKIVAEKKGADTLQALLEDFLSHTPEPISNPKELAVRMARLTHIIRDIIIETFEKDKASVMMSGLRRAFADTLIPDLDKPEKTAEFADMFAQTISYGLFAARVNHIGPGPFLRTGAAAEIPKTNPLLRRLFDTVTGIDLNVEPFAGFVDDLAGLLSHADMETILSEFGRRKKREDPVIHFYETFLAAYDPKLKEKRGVYYTPEPVVSYIVRSVDHILRERFGCPEGLADTGEVTYTRKMEDGKTVEAKSPRVLILDPACGTGTFLYAVVDLIREGFMQRGDAGMWSGEKGYVNQHLLKRLFGFELLMAPYAVAHFKLGMQLAGLDLSEEQRKKWAYDFSGEDRVGVYLTNTLEEAEKKVEDLYGPLKIISDEAHEAASVKRDLPIMVIIGNPPYSGHSANKSWEIVNGKLERTFVGQLLQDYYFVDGKPLGEKNPKWLQDDYVKFIRWAQWRIERTGAGVLAFITNHGYLDNPTFRGMRQNLMKTFTDIYILDLHGNSKKKEKCPDGSKDENVFDIQQGVAIGIFVKEPAKNDPARVHHAELWGVRETSDKESGKYPWLFAQEIKNTKWIEVNPGSPFYLFKPQSVEIEEEYNAYLKVSDVMPVNVLGFQTHRDHFAVDLDESALRNRITEMRNPGISDQEYANKYDLTDSSGWQVSSSRKKITNDQDWEKYFGLCLYRPFDVRHCYFNEIAMDRPRRELLDHVFQKENLCLNTIRQTKSISWNHALISNLPSPAITLEIKDGSNVFPLYIYREKSLLSSNKDRLSNLKPAFVAEIERKIKLSFVPDGSGDLDKTFGPEDIVHYIYAVFHSPTFRTRYAEFLKIDFPRVPLTSDRELFKALCGKGKELVALHLMESPLLAKKLTSYPARGDNIVETGHPKYIGAGEPEPGTGRPLGVGRVYINKTQFIEGIPPDVWEFHVGGYQVLQKWLKDRKGRALTYEDLEHYQKVVVALSETIRIMKEIDGVIPEWPIK